MLLESEYIQYFEVLAQRNKSIQHLVDGKQSFFYIENGDDLDEFDEALRNKIHSPVLLLVGDEGSFNDSESENHTQTIDGQIYILGKKKVDKNIRQIRNECLPVLLDFLARMKKDARTGNIAYQKTVHCRVNNIPYAKVGPMNLDWYGYTATFQFITPIRLTVAGGSWIDL